MSFYIKYSFVKWSNNCILILLLLGISESAQYSPRVRKINPNILTPIGLTKEKRKNIFVYLTLPRLVCYLNIALGEQISTFRDLKHPNKTDILSTMGLGQVLLKATVTIKRFYWPIIIMWDLLTWYGMVGLKLKG